MEYDTTKKFKSQLTDYSVVWIVFYIWPNGPNALSSNTLAIYCRHLTSCHIWSQLPRHNVFFMKLVAENYIAIFAMPVAVSFICDILHHHALLS